MCNVADGSWSPKGLCTARPAFDMPWQLLIMFSLPVRARVYAYYLCAGIYLIPAAWVVAGHVEFRYLVPVHTAVMSCIMKNTRLRFGNLLTSIANMKSACANVPVLSQQSCVLLNVAVQQVCVYCFVALIVTQYV